MHLSFLVTKHSHNCVAGGRGGNGGGGGYGGGDCYNNGFGGDGMCWFLLVL